MSDISGLFETAAGTAAEDEHEEEEDDEEEEDELDEDELGLPLISMGNSLEGVLGRERERVLVVVIGYTCYII